MWDTWTKLCQHNVNHYNEHPNRHITIMAVYGVISIVAIRRGVRMIATADQNNRSGQYANL